MKNKSFFILLLLLFTAISSFLYYAYKNRFRIDELVASVIVNVELEKLYTNDFVVIAEPHSRVFSLAPTSITRNDLQNTVVYTEINDQYIEGLFIKCNTQNSINSIDNITVFIGNKTYYYSQEIIKTLEYREREDGILVRLPVQAYEKSVIKPWINWYGDLNFALKEIVAFLNNPVSFLFVLCCILFFVSVIFKKENVIGNVVKNNEKTIEITGLILLLLFAFLLRINGLTRHSSWIDELYSSTIAANPALPFINTFKDPGNPPLFFVLLRLWFEIFGWSEPSGRMLSVIIGTAGIVTLYCFVKMMCGRKCAFFAAFLLAISSTHIGYSNEMRAYILQMTLAPLVIQRFMLLLRSENTKNYICYILVSAAIVNTHYFGTLLILFNVIYYLVINRKKLITRKSIIYIVSHIIIALSLAPFFIITAFQSALIDSQFNTWIPKPSTRYFILFFMLLISCCVFPFIKRKSKLLKKLSLQSNHLVDYAVYAGSFIFIAAFVISLKRPILTWRYLSICLPILFSILPVIIFNTINYGRFNSIVRVLLCLSLINFSYNFRIFGGGANDVYKEAQEYICADISAHSRKAAELKWHRTLLTAPSYYNLPNIDQFSAGGDYDMVYINPLHRDEIQMFQTLSDAGLGGKNILKIRTNNNKYILKKHVTRRESPPKEPDINN